MQKRRLKRVAAIFLICASFAGCADRKAAGKLYIKALEYYDKKDFEKAGAFINQSLKADKDFFQARFLKAKIYFFQGLYDEAAEVLYDLSKHNSENNEIKTYLIQSLIFSGKHERANRELDAALRNDKGDWRLYYYKSVLASKENNFEQRIVYLNAANEALKSGALVFFDLAFVWECLEVSEKARENAQKCMMLDSAFSELFKEKNE